MSRFRQDETAAGVAKRVTGDARNQHESWFQILDPATSTFVRKARYDHIRPGWRACVANELAMPNNWRAVATSWVARLDTTIETLSRNARAIDPNVILWLGLVAAIVLMSLSVGEYMATRQQTLEGMQHFGEAFIREFERPLLVQGRRTVRLSDLNYGELQELSRTSVPDHIRTDLNLLLIVGRLFGSEAVHRLRFADRSADDEPSKFMSLVHGLRRS